MSAILAQRAAEAKHRALAKLDREGIVSKRVGSRYVSGRTDNWIKVKNPAAPAVKRESEEDQDSHSSRRLACHTPGRTADTPWVRSWPTLHPILRLPE
jgi:hypothetical protein